VISADLHSVGQLRPRDTIRFEEVSLAAARKQWIEQQELLGSEERLFA
jgi:allophanate hydrolase subunit 2